MPAVSLRTALSLRTVSSILLAGLVLAAAPRPPHAAEVPPTASLPLIFNGRDLMGWQVPAEPYWKVVDGVLVGASDEAKLGSMLYTEQVYGDVVVEGEVRFTGDTDSGIMVRKPELQLQIGVSRSLKRDMTCSFYTGKYPEEARARGPPNCSRRANGTASAWRRRGTPSLSGSTASRCHSTRVKSMPSRHRSVCRFIVA